MAEASAATATDYKALVCIFLYGGNDYANTVVPYDPASHASYTAFAPPSRYSQAALAGTVLTPSVVPSDSAGFAHQYALRPAWPS